MIDLKDKDFLFSGGIFKSEAASDGGLNISGYATLEVPDKSGEIVDFPSTVEELQKWSDETAQRSGGKSKGNLRVMHDLALGGKVTDLKAVKANVQGDDGKDQEVNAVLINGYVPPSLPDVIKNVQEGILNGFSIGGKYKSAPRYDATAGANRYTPIVSEISLVDNPCVPGAQILSAIQKAAGLPQKGEDMEEAKKADAMVASEPENTGEKYDGSFDAMRDAVNAAVNEKYQGPDGCFHGYVCRMFPDKAIVCRWDGEQDHYYFIPYTIDENGIAAIGDAEEVQQVTTYIPADEQKSIHDKLKKSSDDEGREKLHEAAKTRSKKYGIGVKEGGALTPPKGKPTDEDDYGDPVNYAYPIDIKHIKPAVSFFNQNGQQNDGGYSDAEWSVIGNRIAAAANKLEGEDKKYSYADGKIQIESKEDNKVTKEEIQKAAEVAGLKGDQLDAFVKAMTEMQKADEGDKNPKDAEGKESEEGGDDEEDCGDEIDDAAKSAAKAAGMSDEMLKAFTGELAKAGKSISDTTGKHLEAMHKAAMESAAKCSKAADFIGKCKKALMDGTPLDDTELVIDTSSIDDGPNSGLEAPAVTAKAVTDELNKAAGGDLGKAFGGINDLQKAVGDMGKSMKSITDVLGELKKTVDKISDQPAPGGPVVESQKFNISALQKADNRVGQADIISEFIKSIPDPQLRDKAGQELAIQMAKAVVK